MNYFGMFFSFMIPGLILGAMAVAAYTERKNAATAKKTALRKTMTTSGKNKLYICDLSADLRETAA